MRLPHRQRQRLRLLRFPARLYRPLPVRNFLEIRNVTTNS